MGYTADQIVVEGIPVEHLEDMEFVERAGEHGCLTLGGYVRAEDGEPLLFHMPQYSPLTISGRPHFVHSGSVSGDGLAVFKAVVFVSERSAHQSLVIGHLKTLCGGSVSSQCGRCV